MNSKQRRNSKRHFPYTIEMQNIDYDDYIKARCWCIEKFGKVGYRWGNITHYSEFHFRKDTDMIMFTLKWA